jgi:type IV pilus assembly protein PilY1
MQRLVSKSAQSRFAAALVSSGFAILTCWSSAAVGAATVPTPVSISQIPLTVTIPAHPQILLALANSQSMDGNLSGAIMTGSGSIAHPLLFPSSSPVNFTIPSGFTPPANPGSGGVAPYTVNNGGQLLDNSPSRLNVAKAGLTAVLNAYMADADFGLMQYNTSGNGEYTTWVYQMSQPGGFTFTNTLPPTPWPVGTEYVPNPCYNVNIAAGFTVSNDCANLNAFYSSQSILTKQWMILGASSDDPSINDVLYAGNGQFDPLCVVYSGPSPISPFPPATGSYSLSTYNTDIAGVLETYGAERNSCANQTGPTNAGFVPFSTQVMYEERGFGFYTTTEFGNFTGTVNPSSLPTWLPVLMASAGATPTAASVTAQINKFLPFLAAETNSTGTTEIKASATQSPMAGMMQQAAAVFATNPATSNGCTTERYVVLVTDGLPTMDLAGHSWPPLGSTAASSSGWNVIANFNPDGSFAMPSSPGPHDDKALIDVINQLTALNSGPHPIKTYIVGVGAGVDPSVNPAAANTLQAMAIAGGTGAAAPRGYFSATSPADVTNDLQIIITAILTQTQSTASAAVNSTGLNVNSKVYQSQFVTSDSPYQDWTGNLFQFGIIASSGVVDTTCTLTPVTCWSSQTQLDAEIASPTEGPSGRIIATWDPVQNKAIPFEWTPGTPSPANGIAVNTTLGMQLQTFTPDTNGQDVLQYLRGSSAKAIGADATTPVGPFRNRSHILGDIIDSNPAYIGASSEGIQSASYIAFAASTASRPPLLYIGANDGMLHAFDVNTGNEKFAYMPRGSYSNLVNLVSPFYNAQHRFFVNGSPQGGDVQYSSDNTWHSILVGTEAQGGKSVYALDVTNPTALTSETSLANAVLWDFTDTDMGLGFASPVIAATAAGWKVFIANGYNSTNQKPILYALDPQTGPGAPPTYPNMIKIDLCAAVASACDLTTANGLSSPIAVNSSGQVAGGANLVYAGDLQGNMWRVDVSNSNPSLWAVSLLFQARDGSGNKQPITTKPVATLNPSFPQTLGTMVLFGTGQFLGVPDISNQSVQSIYGIYDPPAGYTTPPTRVPDLIAQTLSTQTLGSVQVRTVSGASVSIPANKGWYMDLQILSHGTTGVDTDSGERVINDPRLETGGELVLTTYTPVPPSTGSCTTGGSSYLMVLNFATGGNFTTPQFDANGDGFINSTDMVVPTGSTTGVAVAPVGMSLGSVYASAPTIRSGSFANGTGIALITESAVGVPPGGPTPPGGTTPTIQPVILKGSSKSRTAWWEIRQ